MRTCGSRILCAVVLGAVALAGPAWARPERKPHAAPSSGAGSAAPRSAPRHDRGAPPPQHQPPSRVPGVPRHSGGTWHDHDGYPGDWWYPWGVWGAWGWPLLYDPWWYPWSCGGWPCGGWASGGPALPAGPAALETDVKPKSATVFLDGEEVGRAKDYNGTWDVLPIRAGAHVVEFAAPGYMRLRIALDAESGRRYRLEYRLREGSGIDPRSDPEAPPPGDDRAVRSDAVGGGAHAAGAPPASPQERTRVARSFLRFRVAPFDAAVYLDGEFLGQAGELARLHGAIAVASGEHRIEVVRPGHASARESLALEPDETREIRIDLEREGASR